MFTTLAPLVSTSGWTLPAQGQTPSYSQYDQRYPILATFPPTAARAGAGGAQGTTSLDLPVTYSPSPYFPDLSNPYPAADNTYGRRGRSDREPTRRMPSGRQPVRWMAPADSAGAYPIPARLSSPFGHHPPQMPSRLSYLHRASPRRNRAQGNEQYGTDWMGTGMGIDPVSIQPPSPSEQRYQLGVKQRREVQAAAEQARSLALLPRWMKSTSRNSQLNSGVNRYNPEFSTVLPADGDPVWYPTAAQGGYGTYDPYGGRRGLWR